MTKGVDSTGVAITFCCRDEKGRFALAKRSVRARDEWGCWEIPAGAMEFGEAIEDALAREVQKEFDVMLLSYEFMGVRELHRTHEGKQTHWIMLDYLVRVDPSDVKNNDPQKCDEVGWFYVDAFPTPMHSGTHGFLEKNKSTLFP